VLIHFPAAKAYEHARSLCFPRRAGGGGAERARQYIVGELEKWGYRVDRESFPVQADPSLFLRALLALSLLSLVVSFQVSRTRPHVASLLILLPALLLIFARHLWVLLVSHSWPVKPRPQPGVNLLTSLPPSGEGARHILLVAHYDSKAQTLSLIARTLLLICLALLMLFLSSVYLSFGHPVSSLYPFASRQGIGFLSAVTALCALLLYRNKTFDGSPGALDDAGGVGVLLGLAEVLRERPPARVGVDFLLTDAEEEGLWGSWFHVRSHRDELLRQRPQILNLDGVGIGGRLRLYGASSSRVRGDLLSLARCCGIPLKHSPGLPGVLMDHVPFRFLGLEAVSLFCLSAKSLRIHTRRDGPDLLDEEGLREAGELILCLLEEGGGPISSTPSSGSGVGPDCQMMRPDAGIHSSHR